MLFNKIIGAGGVSLATPIEYIGSTVKEASNGSGWDTSGEAPNVLGIASTGDLVVVSFSFGNGADSSWSWVGMNFTQIVNETNTTDPGSYLGYRFVQSGDTNPYISGVTSSSWGGIAAVFSVFRYVNSYVAYAKSSGDSNLQNPPALTANGRLWIATAQLDSLAVNNWDIIPSGYTFAARARFSGTGTSSTILTYKIATLTSDDPSTFNNGPNSDQWKAYTVAFN
jgi:hypothetical protein